MAPTMAPSLRPSSLYMGTRCGVLRYRPVRIRPSRTVSVPVQALFGFGARPGKSSQNERALELEEDIFSLVRGKPSASLSPKMNEELNELVSECGRANGDQRIIRLKFI